MSMPKMNDKAQIKPLDYDAATKRLMVLMPDGTRSILKSVDVSEFQTWTRSKSADLYFRRELYGKKEMVEEPRPAVAKPAPAKVEAHKVETQRIGKHK